MQLLLHSDLHNLRKKKNRFKIHFHLEKRNAYNRSYGEALFNIDGRKLGCQCFVTLNKFSYSPLPSDILDRGPNFCIVLTLREIERKKRAW